MEENSYNSTHPLGHTGLVTGSFYLYLYPFYHYTAQCDNNNKVK